MGWRTYRSDPWKLVFVSESFGGTRRYALYNLDDDPGEIHDLSEQYPEKAAELAEKWARYAETHGVANVPMAEVNQIFDEISDRFFELYWGY